MPKESININKFQAGIISNVSERDIPLDAASEALNIDPLGEKGILRGIKDDDVIVNGNSNDFPLYQESELINHNGTDILVGFIPRNHTNAVINQLSSLANPFTDTTPTELGSLTIGGTGVNISECCMEANNQEVHIGFGEFASKWVGIIQYKQFGIKNANTTFGAPNYVDAELESPSNFKDLYKVIHVDANYLYGIKWQGNYIYKFHKTNLTIEKSKKRFISTQGLTIFHDGNLSDRSPSLWVYDAGESEHGTLYKYSTALESEEFAVTLSIPSAASGEWNTDQISDIIHIEDDTNLIWFYRPIEGDNYPDENLNTGNGAWLWNIAEPTAPGSATLASKTPRLKPTSVADSSNQGEWFGIHEDGIFYKALTDFNHTDQDDLAQVKTSFLDDQVIPNLYFNPQGNYNRYVCSGLHWDDNDGLLYGFYPDYLNETSANSGTLGSAKLVIMRVDREPSSTYGNITIESTHDVGWNGTSTLFSGYPTLAGGPDYSTSTYDDINKVFFCTADFLLFSHKITGGTSVSSFGDITHASGTTFVKNGAHATGEFRRLAVDAEEKLLFGTNEAYGLRIYPYLDNGKILDVEPSAATYDDGSNSAEGLALDTKNKFVFISYSNKTITSLAYTPSENPSNTATSFSVITNKISCQGTSYAIGSARLAVDTDNRILFAAFRADAATEELIESYSYDEVGNLTQVGFVKGNATYNSAINDYTPLNIVNISDQCDVKVDADSKVVMVHNGKEILSFKYNADGTFESDNINNMEQKNKRVTYKNFNTNTQNNNSGFDGLGLSIELIQSGKDFGAQSKNGLLVVGSNTGRIRSRAYSRHSSKVYMPKAGFTRVLNKPNAISVPVCFNNSTENQTTGNHIYYIGASGTYKSQIYWLCVDHSIDPSLENGTETLNGTVGEALIGTTNSTTEGLAKIYAADVNQHTAQKMALTGSTLSDGKDLTTLFSYDHASNNMLPDFDETSFTQAASLNGINLKEASVVIQDDADDATIDLFEGATRGTGKWGQVIYDRDLGEYDHPVASNTSGKVGGMIAAPVEIKFKLVDFEDEEDSGKGVLKNKKYFYKISYVYDGYQEGPLGDEFVFIPEKDGNVLLNIELKGLSALPARVTNLNVYKSETTDLESSKPLGYYRQIQSFKLDTQWSLNSNNIDINPNWGNFRSLEYLDDGAIGVSFESSAGYSSVLDDVSLNYGLSTQLNNTHFVSRISNPVLDEEGQNFVAKSLPFKFDTFDITKDILRVPNKLTALKGFAGRIWAFSENEIYKIEPNAFFIEDTIKGIGCVHHKAMASTPVGLFWMNRNNIYWHDGQKISPIGEAIKTGNTYSIDKIQFEDDTDDPSDVLDSVDQFEIEVTNHTQPVTAVWDSNMQAVLFWFKLDSNNQHYAYLFHVPSQRWELVSTGGAVAGKICNAITAPNGYSYYWVNEQDGSLQVPLYKFAGHASNKRNWSWSSKEINIGNDSQSKHFNSIKLIGTNNDLSSQLTLKVDGSTVTESFSANGNDGLYKLPFGSRKGKSLKIQLSNVPSANEVDAIGVTFRRKNAK